MYSVKFWEELGWLALVAVASFLLQELVTFDAASITDWRAWGIALASGGVRALAVAGLAAIGKAKMAS